MSDVIFAAPQYYLDGGYRSYGDFFRLVALSGYPVIPVPDIDPDSDNVYIFPPTNEEQYGGWPGARARIIAYELELPLTGWRKPIPGVSEVWVGDAWLAKQAEQTYFIARYVPLGSHPGLNVCNGERYSKQYDVAQIMYQNGRRTAITNALFKHGVHLAPPDGLWGTDRSQVLLQSRLMLHVHQWDNMPAIAPLRWCIAAAHKLPLISEYANDFGVFDPYTIKAEYNALSGRAAIISRDNAFETTWANYGAALHQFMCVERTFRQSIEAAL